MESKSGASTTSFTEISGLRTKEKSAEYLWDRRASDQMSSQKVTVEPSVQSPYLDYLKIIITTATNTQIMEEIAETTTFKSTGMCSVCPRPVRPVPPTGQTGLPSTISVQRSGTGQTGNKDRSDRSVPRIETQC